MGDATKTVLSVIETKAERLPDLPIKAGQFIFISDVGKIALDLDGTRTFYNQINSLQAETDRTSLENPIKGGFYFVIETAVLWLYDSGWHQITTPPSEIIYFGEGLPLLGAKDKLYVDKTNKNISVWDENQSSFTVVSDTTIPISEERILSLFN